MIVLMLGVNWLYIIVYKRLGDDDEHDLCLHSQLTSTNESIPPQSCSCLSDKLSFLGFVMMQTEKSKIPLLIVSIPVHMS